MSPRGVQLVIGKLLTDADFRQRFEAQAREGLAGLREQGIDVNESEMTALVETDPGVWLQMARRIDQRLHQVTTVTSEPTPQRLPGELTPRQQRVLAGVCEGLSNKDIAAAEGVSEGAVKATLQQLFRRTGVRRRTQLFRLAIAGAVGSARHRPDRAHAQRSQQSRQLQRPQQSQRGRRGPWS
jgi:DNA-binding CsgD family transcriptional regulator